MRTNPTLRRLALSGTLALVLTAALAGQTVFQNPEYQYVVDIPAGWEILDAQQPQIVSFTDPNRVAVFQILAFPGNQFATVEEIDRYIREQFSAQGDAAPYQYLGDPAMFADYQFDTGSFIVRGYMTFLNRDEFDFAVMTYVPEDYYQEYHDLILSAVDSFSPSVPSRTRPGPVSQFFSNGLEAAAEQAAGDGATAEGRLTLPAGTDYQLPATLTSPDIQEAHQVLIEREARVLSAYAPTEGATPRPDPDTPPEWVTAWRRYFRMIYRDSFDRLQPVAEALFQDLVMAGVPREDMPAHILEWLQTAEYARTRSLSDLMSPALCLVSFSGDCDSLGLTYAILLNHLGFDAILMVSIEYAHALVGVDVPGEGARFPFEDRQWLVAELTEEVGIGMIAQDMSDIGGWIGVELDPTAP